MVGARRAPTSHAARAFAPGHVTGVFSPDLTNRDPRARGSIGAGLVLEAGAYAEVRYTPTRPRRLIARPGGARTFPISTEVARRLWEGRPGRLEVSLRHELPVGQGFGMSAAGALAVGLAVASVLHIPKPRAVVTAHLAELFGRGGLGGVASILGGGLELRTQPGVPPWGTVQHYPASASIFLTVSGPPMPSPGILRNDRLLDRIRESGGARVRRLARHAGIAEFFREAERFSDDLGLAPPSLRAFLRWLAAHRIDGAQAMFGNAGFAWARTPRERALLRDAVTRRGWPAVELGLSATGARLLRTPRKAF